MQSFPKPYYKSVIVIFLFVITLFFVIPVYIYCGNASEFTNSFSDILPLLILLFIFVFFIFLIIFYFLSANENLYEKALLLLFSFSLLEWIQANWINWDYGELDGNIINWSEHTLKGVIDITIWCMVIGAVIFFHKFFLKKIIYISVFMILIQLITAVIFIKKLPTKLSYQEYTADKTNKFVFSDQKNVILILLDAFQSDVFNEIINEDTLLRKELDGFDFFRNTTSTFPKTYLSVSNILTEKTYNNKVPISSFIQDAFLSETSIPLYLKRKDYIVDLYPWDDWINKTIYLDKSIMSNIIKIGEIDYAQLSQLYDLALFRLVPHFLKKYIYRKGEWFLKSKFNHSQSTIQANSLRKIHFGTQENILKNQNLAFINEFFEKVQIKAQNPTFKYYHLQGAHKLFSLGENFQYTEYDDTRNGYKKNARNVLKIMGIFLQKLKDANIYDQSMIVIVSDHGGTDYFNGFDNSLLESKYGKNRIEKNKNNVVKDGLPIFLIKTCNAESGFRINDIPVSLNDVSRMIIQAEKNNFKVKSVLILLKDTSFSKKRYHYEFERSTNDFEKEFLLPMTEYVVSGHSWLGESWNVSGKVFYPDYNYFKNSNPTYKINQIINFDMTGEYFSYVKKGFDKLVDKEKAGSVTKNEVIIKIPINRNRGDLILNAKLGPYSSSPTHINQLVLVSANECSLGHWVVDKDSSYLKIIPVRCLEDELTLTLNLPDTFWMPNEETLRSINIKSIALTEYYMPGDTIVFKRRGNFNKYVYNGFSVAELSHAWTDGYIATLVLPIEKNNIKQYSFIFNAGIYQVEEKLKTQHINILINEVFSKTLVLNNGGKHNITFDNPLPSSNGFIKITFLLPDANSPKVLENKNDPRLIALRFYWAVLSAK